VFSYKEKSFALSTGIDKAQRKLSRSIFNNRLDINDLLELQKQFDDKYGQGSFKIGLALNQSRYKRKQRVQDRITHMIFQGAVFLTLTFAQSVLDTTTEETRRKYVRRWLKDFTTNYIANIDYGGKKGREHYHAVVQCDQADVPSSWSGGFMNARKINPSMDDIQAVSKYIAKLTNHALKQSAQLKRIIYSKKL
jgi:hypothetical protein